MVKEASGQLEFTNLVEIIANWLGEHSLFAKFLHRWESVIFSLIIVFVLSLVAFFSFRRPQATPNRFQAAMEFLAASLDDFVCGILGPKGRKLTPFIGTLFIYILCMNLFGLIPFMKSATSSLSTTFGLAICVFVYVHYLAIRELGLFGYFDHLMGKPRGALALTIILPAFMLFIHIISELIKPLSLSLRLRSNIFADDMLLAAIAGFGIKGVGLLLFSSCIVIISAVVQAVVFSLLSTIYFALFLKHEDN
ncbi:MAG: F0F1 ATP synthase subunit A [Candidatus Omnitrophica bacterium]|nr:F0F1 ATP synthase subunit A [Candidatus Omnitrophota bacterium]